MLWVYNDFLNTFIIINPNTLKTYTLEEFFDKETYQKHSLNKLSSKKNIIPKTDEGCLLFLKDQKTFTTYCPNSGFSDIHIKDTIDNAQIYHANQDQFLVLNESSNKLYIYNFNGKQIAFIDFKNEIVEDIHNYVDDNKFIVTTIKNTNTKTLAKYYEIDSLNRLKIFDFKIGDDNFIGLVDNYLFVKDASKNLIIREKGTNDIVENLTFTDKTETLIKNTYTHLKSSNGDLWVYGPFGITKMKIKKSIFKNYFTKTNNNDINHSIRGILKINNSLIANSEFLGTIKAAISDPTDWQWIEKNDNFPRPILPNNDTEFLVTDSKKIKSYTIKKDDIKKIEEIDFDNNVSVWSSLMINNNQTLIGTDLDLKIKNGDLITKVITSENKISETTSFFGPIYQIIEAGNQQYWLCTESGLHLIDIIEKRIIATYNDSNKGKNYLPASTFYSFHEDKNGVVWLATTEGLIKWDKNNARLGSQWKLYTRSDGLPTNTLFAIIEDDNNKLWISSNNGLMMFDKTSESIKSFLKKDGISDSEFNRSSFYRDDLGYIYFGSLNGITSFHPKNIVLNESFNPNMVLTSVEIYDNKQSSLLEKTKEALNSKIIHIYPRNRFLKLKYSLLSFENPNEMLFAWKINKLHDDWNYVKENQIQINKLPYGKHQLTIKGLSGGSNWSPNVLNYQIQVHKPFYLTYTFFFIGLLTFLFTIWQFFNYRRRKLIAQNQQLQVSIMKATEKIRLDKDLIEKQASELTTLNELKSRFFANVSHELKTPLSLMLGPIQHLKKTENRSPDENKLLELLEKNTENLKVLVEEILELSKIENNKVTIIEEPVILYDFLLKLMLQYESLTTQRGFDFGYDISATKDVPVLLDTAKFLKIINNYFSNALKYSTSGGKIFIAITITETQIILAVKDEGEGIHTEDIPYVFDRFYQSVYADRLKEGGTGIGLSLAKELTKLLGGQVWVESTLNKGSTFYASIAKKPTVIKALSENLSLEDNITKLKKDKSKTKTNHNFNKLILVVEDNKDLLEYYKIILKDYGLATALNGEKALEFLNQTAQKPDLIISDVMMPVMDGIALIKNLRKDKRWIDIPIIMLTAKTNQNTKMETLRIGIDDYISKPFNEEELLLRINNLLSRQNNRIINTKENNEIIDSLLTEEFDWLSSIEHLVKNKIAISNYNASDLAQEANMSLSTLNRKMKKLTGLTPKKYIQEFRLALARQLIDSNKDYSISQIAFKVGFTDASAFSRAFKKRFGISPTERLNEIL